MAELVSDASVVVDGVAVHYECAGSGSPLVLVHGLLGAAGNWEQNIGAWARLRTVYALDQVNMGKSGRIAGVDAVGLDAVDIAGHSHGGAIVMMLAERHPERVRHMKRTSRLAEKVRRRQQDVSEVGDAYGISRACSI